MEQMDRNLVNVFLKGLYCTICTNYAIGFSWTICNLLCWLKQNVRCRPQMGGSHETERETDYSGRAGRAVTSSATRGLIKRGSE